MFSYNVMACSTILNPLRLATLSVILALPAGARSDSFRAPDHLILKNGRTVNGLIVRNSADAVLLQEQLAEVSYPKSEIVRIIDHPDDGMMYTDIGRKGELPSWRVIANDLRTNDAIRSLVEIPATRIDTGEFKNVPYKSFRVNQDIELNIYGDPENPAGLEVGIYGARSGIDKLRKTLRSHLAGYLTSRDEISKLYSLELTGGLAVSSDLTFEITPESAPDAYGAWWVSAYNSKAMAKTRLSDEKYNRVARPMSEVIDKNGQLIAHRGPRGKMDLSAEFDHLQDYAEDLISGFYRDKDGVFRLLTGSSQPRTGNGAP